MIPEERGANGVEILTKVGAVIDALQQHGPSSVTDLAARVNEPVSSLYRLLRTLGTLGWIEPGRERGLYRLGIHFVRVGGMVESRLRIQHIAWPTMRAVSSELRTACSLFVRRGLRAVCIDVAEDDLIRRFPLRVGDSMPLDRGAAAATLTAFLPQSERDSIAASLHENSKPGEPAIVIRQQGYSTDIGQTSPGVLSVAAPVFNHRGEIEAALCISGFSPVEGLPPSVRERLQGAAQTVSAALGHRRIDLHETAVSNEGGNPRAT